MTAIPNQVKWVKVFQNLASDLKALVSLADGSTIEVTQDTPADLKALVTLSPYRGVLPNPATAVRIVEERREISNETRELYTVSANSILIIDSATLSIFNTSGAAGRVRLEVQDEEDALWSVILAAASFTGSGGQVSRSYPRGLVVPALYDVILYSPAASVYATGGFSGWIETV